MNFLTKSICSAWRHKVTRGIMVLTLFMGHVQAQEVFYGYKSHHWSSSSYTNDTHHMVGLKVSNFIGGRFDNSYGDETYFIGKYGSTIWGNLEGFAIVGGMYGYKRCYGNDDSSKNVCPMLALGVSYLGVSRYFKPSVFQLGDATVIGFRSEF